MKYLVVLLFLVGCTQDPLAVRQTDNPNFKVEFLFEYEGCRIYRFMDDRYVYYTVCAGRASQITYQYTVNCGKNCTRHLMPTVSTVYR